MIEIDCNCGQIVPVRGIETTLRNEDYMPVTVYCKCGAKYRVNLHMDILEEGNGKFEMNEDSDL